MAGRRPKRVAEDPDLFGDARPAPAGPAPAETQRPETQRPEDLRAGHRERLRARFMAGGRAAVSDYELLELVLFRAISRQDVNPLAKKLLAHFGDVNAVISATPERLREVPGAGDAVVRELKIVEAAAHRLAETRMATSDPLSSATAVTAYCRTTMAHAEVEQFLALFLDAKNRVLDQRSSARGTVDSAPVYPREIAKRALELGASAVILAHNHPSGDPEPSEADVRSTRAVAAALGAIGVKLHDHLIIGKGREVSLRARRLI